MTQNIWLKPHRLWTKNVKVLQWLSQTQNSIQSNIWGMTWNWSSQTVSIQFDVSRAFFGVFCGVLEEYKGTECFFVGIARTLHLFVFKDLQIIVMEVMGASFVLVKHQNIVNKKNEALFTGTDAEGQEEDVCLHRPNTLLFSWSCSVSLSWFPWGC